MLGKSVGTDVNYGRDIASEQMDERGGMGEYAPLIVMHERSEVVAGYARLIVMHERPVVRRTADAAAGRSRRGCGSTEVCPVNRYVAVRAGVKSMLR